MSMLFDHVFRKYETGHAAAPQALWIDPRIHEIESFIPAAVLVTIVERERPGMLFLHRPSNMRAHAGQIAFPGGRVDPGEDAVTAALREAWEELGIDRAAVRVVGESDRYRTGSGYEITPVIGVVSPDIEIRPNPAEVAQWFEAPVDFVLDPANQQIKSIEWEDRTHNFVEIDWEGHQIWGVTGAILHNLAGRLKWHD
ncbi:CoA pyrophosphatase [Novosphingobium sp. PC22D]|uniref:CoA pyrophosphatase n=1 Tax=Novosphingobium sp. PC22D TaxID=1962403 RepID=UPI000BF1F03A|nr:CoA pyrophosphatase [Novosphingobium sp. PC22D]PEQ13305.1 CoA pyrophosphatase [Novosphingobium sp. PC22D]